MSPKGHFCTLSLLRRNQAASWEEPQPGEGEPRTLAMPCRRCGSGRTQPPPPPAWHCLPIPSDPTPDPPTGGPRPRHGGDQERWNTPKGKGGGGKKSQSQATKKRKKEKRKKRKPTLALIVCGFLCRARCSLFQQRLLLALQGGRGHLPPLGARSTMVKYSRAVPCSRVCSSTAALRRPICLADHCLFDVAANVTFLFQSKTQQGVPSVWHSPRSLPRCLFVQIILRGNLHGSFIPRFREAFHPALLKYRITALGIFWVKRKRWKEVWTRAVKYNKKYFKNIFSERMAAVVTVIIENRRVYQDWIAHLHVPCHCPSHILPGRHS